MIKVLTAVQRHPRFESLRDFHCYWVLNHAPLAARQAAVRRYATLLTLPEAIGIEPSPTFDGASLAWYEDLDALSAASTEDEHLRQAIERDAQFLGNPAAEWPRHAARAHLVAEEHVRVDRETRPDMVKLISIVARRPGLTHEEFFERWSREHAALVARIPGVRRHVQNHVLVDALPDHGMTHDGWSEVWYDDVASLHAATLTREWQAVREHATRLVHEPRGSLVALEHVHKEIDLPLPEPEASDMTEDEIRARLAAQGYRTLAADPAAPARIRRAAETGALALWTETHLVTLGDPPIDARPEN